ncbi:hypothetical protein F4803DRAFT_533221 [Xylaria telfairii]|nr:hypothetical protein F4803DRAFT_533221 [Xylaria telfairii]
MANVYHGAKNVCIWLGEADAQRKSDEAMRFIPEIMDFAVLDRHARDKNQARKWYALAELMRDRWFSRRWVVQEIALARSATIHCGDEMVHWLDFADAVSLLASNQEIIKNLFSDWRDGPNTLGEVKSFGAYILLEATSKLFLRMAKGGIRRPITSIESLVTSLKTFDTSDQRDLIYSLVSIACDTTQNSGVYSTDTRANESQQLVIDYRKPEVEVYIDFTKFCIKSSCSLDIFCRPWAMPVKASDSSSNTAQIPSWIPLLSTSEYGAPDDVYSGRKNGENLVGPVGSPRYKASGNKKYSAEEKNEEVENSNQSLLVRGFKLGKIERVSPRSTGGVIVRESLMMGFKKGTLNYGDSVPDKIWRTLVADRDPHGQIPPAWYQRACLRCLEIADTFNNGDLNIGELLQGNSDMLRKYLTRVRNVTWNRRFFTARRWNEHTESISIRKSGSFGVSTVSQENKLGDSGAQSKQDKQSKQVGSGDDVDAAAATGVGSTNQAQEKDDDQDTDGSNGGSSEEEVSESEDDNEGSGKEEVLKSGDDNRSDGGIHNRKVNKNNENEDDELFGLGPPQMTEGDIICILFGSSVPVVLRRITEESAQVCYQLVGEVYAHGQMDGEAISDFEEQIIEMNEETFELR